MNKILHELIIIDDRALIVSVLRELCLAIQPDAKAKVFDSIEEYLDSGLHGKILIASTDFQDGLFMPEKPYEKRPEFEGSVVVFCGEISQLCTDKADFVIDLRASATKIVSVLRLAMAASFGDSGGLLEASGLSAFEMGLSRGRKLTPKQVAILELSSQGMSAQEIADLLHVTVNTVRGHIQEIFARLNVKNIAHAVALYGKINKLKDFAEEGWTEAADV